MSEDSRQYHWSVVYLEMSDTKYDKELFEKLSKEYISQDAYCESLEDELEKFKSENARLQQEFSELKTFCGLWNKFSPLFK